MYPALFGHKSYGRITQSAGTKIVRVVEPSSGAFTVLTYLEVTVGATAHTLTVMKPLGVTTLSAAAAAAQAVINLTADPGDYTGVQTADNGIAANDRLIIELPDGTFHQDIVSSVATLAITMTNNIPTGGAAAGAKVWFYGVEANSSPFDALAHAVYTLPANGTKIFGGSPGDSIAGWFGSNAREEPLLLIIDNATNASVLERVQVAYSTKGGKRWS